MKILRFLDQLEGKTIRKVVNVRTYNNYSYGDITIEFTDDTYVIIRPEVTEYMTATIYNEPLGETENIKGSISSMEEDAYNRRASGTETLVEVESQTEEIVDNNKILSPEEIQVLIEAESQREEVADSNKVLSPEEIQALIEAESQREEVADSNKVLSPEEIQVLIEAESQTEKVADSNKVLSPEEIEALIEIESSNK